MTSAAMDQVIRMCKRIEALEAALRPFVRHYDTWMDDADGYPDHIVLGVFPKHTYGELRAARAALDPTSPTGFAGHSKDAGK